MTREDFLYKLVAIDFEGSVKHAAGERHSRVIQNYEREKMINKFITTNEKPSKIYQEVKQQLPSNSKASRNRTGCGVQPSTIRKISSEAIERSQLDKNTTLSLDKLRRQLIDQENSREIPPTSISGFIHNTCHFPLVIYMWTEDQVRLWHELAGKDVSYIDATGTILRNLMTREYCTMQLCFDIQSKETHLYP